MDINNEFCVINTRYHATNAKYRIASESQKFT